ncbi:MAG: hypothetical protein J7499_14045 [Sphingopyxis sp.]|nr:hypothetical protein [Sphingopyxis sp.]
MIVSAKALELAGFLLAHALWVSSELKEGELYVPQALCESTASERQLFVFEAPTQQEAIDKGKQFLQAEGGRFARCIFARDGQADPGSGYVDLLTLDIVEGDLPPKLTVIQPYKPAASGHFQLLGKELLLDDTGQLGVEKAKAMAATIHNGAASHPGASREWHSWNAERSERNPLQ